MDPSIPPRRPRRPPLFSLPTAMSVTSLRGLSVSSPPSGAVTPRTPYERDTTSLLGRDDEEEDDEERGAEADGLLPGYGSVGSSAGVPSRLVSNPRRRKWTKRAKYYIPSIAWIPEYSWSFLGGDIIAGFTVACMLIPQSVSYATSLAKLNPVTGLFAASIPPIVYALLGTSRQLNVAPEAALSLLVGQAVSEIVHAGPHGHPDNPVAVGMAVATMITLQAGLMSFLLGLFRLGFIDVVLSRALLQGFVAAVAVVITIQQLISMFGLEPLMDALPSHPHTTLEKFIFLVEYVPELHVPTTAISFGAFGVLVLARACKNACAKWWWIYRLPEVLIVVVVSTVLSDQLRWDERGVDILGDVPINLGKHFFQFPISHFSARYLKQTTSTAILCSVAGYLDSIVAAKQNAARFGYSVSPNRELVALGAANLVGSFVPGTLPAYGSITRSKINGDCGGRTQLASLVCAAIILLATFFLIPWMYFLPECVLASVICLVVVSLLRETPHEVRYYVKMRAWTDLALMTLTFILSVFWNIEMGIIVSLIASLLLVVRRSSKARMTILGRIPGTDRWKPISENPDAQEDVPGAMIVRIRENLDFANTAQLKERLRRLELYGLDHSHPSEDPRRQQASMIVFHLADVEHIDASAVQIFLELLQIYKARGVRLLITHLRSGPRRMFERAGIIDLLGEGAFFENVGEAMAGVQRYGSMGEVPTIGMSQGVSF